MNKITIGSIIILSGMLLQFNPVRSQKTVANYSTIPTDEVNLTVLTSLTLSPDALALRYDSGENSNSYGLTGGGTFYWAAYWPSSTMGTHIGLSIYSVDVYIGDVGGAETLYIWDQGSSATQPGAVLYTASFTPAGHSWEHIELSSPVAISGNDLWIGIEVSSQPVGETPAGGDTGPANTGFGDMLSTDGITFGSSGLNYNWNISANLDDPGCLSPTNLTAYNTTTTSATLAWTDNAGVSSFDIELLLHNTPPTGSPSVSGVGNPTVISQLNPDKIYDYYVRAYCSPWSGPYSFSTACYKINAFPYTETFDNNQTAGSYTGCTLDGSVPLWYCWSNNMPDDFDWNVQSGPTPTANTGPVDDVTTGGKYLYTESSGCNGSTAYVVGPEFNFDNLSVPGISFYYHMDGTEMGTMSLEVSTDQGTSWSELWTKNGAQGSPWQKQTIALFGYEGNTSVMFRWKGVTGTGETSDMALDQVIVGESTEGAVEGYVTTAGTNVPLENALVSIGSYTDLTDNTGYYKIENIPLGTYTVTCEFTDYVTQQIEDYIVVPGISTLDFEMPYGNSPTSMDASGSDGQVDLSWGPPLPIEGEIKYDNGVVGAWGTLGTPQNSQQMFYVRFTAPEAGFINQVAVFNKSDASVNWNTIRVCPETGITPDLNNPYETFTGVNVNSLEGEWELLSLTSPFAVTAGQDFYVVTQWNDGSTVGPRVGIDIDAPYAGRSAYTMDGGSNWVIQSETDWIMRAYYTTTDDKGLLLTTIPQTKAKDISLPEFNVADKEQQKKAGSSQKTYFAKPYQVPLIVSVNPIDNKALTGYNIYKGTGPASLSFLISIDVATTEYVDNAVINGTKYYYEVKCVYDEGYSAASNLVSAIPLSVTSGFPFSTDFEADNGGFSGIGDWQWGEPVYVNGPGAANSGQNVWGTILDGDYNPQQASMLVQAFDLSGGIDITLKFAKWFDMVPGTDYCQVAVDQDNDDVYEILKTYTGSETYWEDAYVKIPAEYTSAYTKLAFIFTSNTTATAPGFYLDDLSLAEYEAPEITVNPVSVNISLAPDEIKEEHLNIGNDGGFSVDYIAEITEYNKNSDADILFENFDAGIPQGPGEWTIVDGGEPLFTWEGVSDYNGETIDGTPFAIVSSEAAGNVVMDEYLESPVFDGTGYQAVLLEFDQVLVTWQASVEIEVFDGWGWNWVAGFSYSQGAFGNPDHQVIDITDYLYSPTSKVRFHYYSESEDFYWAIDNVKISDISLPADWLTLNGGQTAGGAVLPGNTDDIIVGFDATGIPTGTYYTNIEITSNDPVNPVLLVPVTMTVSDRITLDLKVFLEGPWVSGSKSVMSTHLNDNDYLPLSQPYNPDLPYYQNDNPVWLYSGNENVTEIPTGVVDWILVQVRDADSPGNATSSTIIGTQAAFLLSDGSVVGLDGFSMLDFYTTVNQNLYVVIYHRNHLGIMSGSEVTSNNDIYSFDFSIGETQAYGTDAQKEIDTDVWGMISGDGNADGTINTDDKNNVWLPFAGFDSQQAADFDMNTQINNQDKNNFLIENLNYSSQIPD